MTTSKKVAKKAVKKVVSPTERIKDGDNYHVVMKFNDQVFDFETDNLEQAILEKAPRFLKTKLVFEIEKGDKKVTKMLFVRQGKMLFRNKLSLAVFISRLIFK